MKSRQTRARAGAAIWALALAALAALAHARAADLGPPAAKLARFLFTRTDTNAVLLVGPLQVGDPVLDGERRYVGRVAAIASGTDGTRPSLPAGAVAQVVLAIDPELAAAVPVGARFRTRTAPRDGKWVFETLLPPAKRARVAHELRTFADEHGDAIATFVRPIAEDVIEHGMTTLEANLKDALKARQPEIDALLTKHRALVKDDLLPVLKRELGPSAKAKAQPLLREIGRELWNELPMWSLGWNAFVDVLPGTSKTRVDAWWAQFLEEKAIPIVAAHEDELLRALEDLIEEGARSPAVRQALGSATRRLAQDPDFKALVRGVLEDALVRPFEPAALIERLVADPVHQERFEALSDSFGPTLQRIGRALTIDEETGAIDPDLARVLRRVVFHKDARWVEVTAPRADAPQPPTRDL